MEAERSLAPFAVALRQARLSRTLAIADVMKATLLSDRQIIGLENNDHAYFYNTTFARRSAETYAALLGVDPELEGAPSRENSGPPRLVVSIDTRSGSTPRIGCLASRHLRFLWLVMVVAILLAYFFSASGP